MKQNKQLIKAYLKEVVRPLYNKFANKYATELGYWKKIYLRDGQSFENGFYKKIFLNLAQEQDDKFLENKIVADFGCGPRGSLKWIKSAKQKIGIDVLADQYLDHFGQDMLTHDMLYLKSTEKIIPLPNESLDVMFTLNALDHVDNFPQMCNEIYRTLKENGILYASFNLGEKATSAEPQCLTEKLIHKYLLDKFEILTYRVANQGPQGNLFKPLYENDLHYDPGQEGILWVKARKE